MLPLPYLTDEPLSRHCSFEIGGPARFFVEVRKEEDLVPLLSYSYQEQLPFFILGKGSNILFEDRGFNGIVIVLRNNKYHMEDGLFTVGGGYSFARLGKLASRQGYTGLEFASGIPGSVGGAIFMNAGANGQETQDTLEWVEYLDITGIKTLYQKKDLVFSYRYSSFQNSKGIILNAAFRLQKGEEPQKKQREYLSYRLHSQPYKLPSAGCIFRNTQTAPAGFLIEKCGLKGERVGGAAVSHEHANFIINLGEATSHDILTLIEKIKNSVFEETGIMLIEEIKKIPYES